MTFLLKENVLKKILIYLVSFSAGGLFSGAFIHIIPEAIKEKGYGINISILILFGITFSFALEKILRWRHCHIITSEDHPHSFAYMNLFGDAVHNFVDGLIIGGSYLVRPSLGIATTLAVVLHEIPQEIGDFGVLLYGGFSKKKAIYYNFLTALTALIGTITALSLGFLNQHFVELLLPFAAGNFIYIAGSDLIPELRKDEPNLLKSTLLITTFFLGVFTLFILIYLE
jgi:zinc and cadmium transporter